MSLTRNSTLHAFKPSGIRRFSALASANPDCISLTIGEPAEDTPQNISALVDTELKAKNTHYPPNVGYPELRDAIAAWECERGFSVTPDGVVVTVGATEALFASLAALLNPGDEVIIPSPTYIVYSSITTLLHATPVVLDTVQTDFQISLDALMAAVTKKTKAIVLTSPNNPTGCILSYESLDAVARVAAEKNFYVICDDVYRELSYVQDVPRFAAKYPQLADRIIVTNSFSAPANGFIGSVIFTGLCL